jgi:hypothetical protein
MKIKEYNNHTYMTRIAIITCLLGYSFGALAQCVEDTSFDADDLSIRHQFEVVLGSRNRQQPWATFRR